ncbi:MAG TPA: hypothetical protein VH600_01370 [Burkholderiales bacterium]|jgi:hypothetical protein
MRVSVGQISAHCEVCGCEEFQPKPGELSCPTELACFNCGLVTTRRTLLMQVSNETVRRAQAFLEAARKARR